MAGAIGEDGGDTTITNGNIAPIDNGSVNSGAVYVYKRTGATWDQEAYIKAANNDLDDEFGYVVAISGDTLAVSSVIEGSNETTITNGATASADNSNAASGAVYVYKRTEFDWAQEAYIKAANGEADDRFGEAIDIFGNTLVVGVPAEDSNETTITNGTTASADNSTVQSGAVYVYKRTDATWAQEAYIKAPNADSGDLFGSSVAYTWENGLMAPLVVGSPEEDSNQTTITNGETASADDSSTESGAVYVFVRADGTNWSQQAYLKAPNNGSSDRFGSKVEVSGQNIVVGAIGEDSNQTTITDGNTASINNDSSGSGAVYVFHRIGTTWDLETYIKAANNDASDNFGDAVAISGETVVVGAPRESSNQNTITNGDTANSDNSVQWSGAVYVYLRE